MPKLLRKRKPNLLWANLGVALLTLTSCASSGGTDNPIGRGLGWFSYVGAEDIRAQCGPQSRDRLRFVYNGIYGVQLRTYDVTAEAGDFGATAVIRVIGESNLLDLTLADPLVPWRGVRGDIALTRDDYLEIKRAVLESGFHQPAPFGLRLPSAEFYWIVGGCLDGRFRLNAWLHPSERFERLRFPTALLIHDPTGVPYYGPRPLGARPTDYIGSTPRGTSKTPSFQLQLGVDRLIGTGALF